MQSYFERRGPRLDTSLPSVRYIQGLIREGSSVSVQLVSGEELVGTMQWQDPHFLALRLEEEAPVVLLSLRAIAILRALG